MARKRLDILLVERGLFESRAKAVAAIEAGLVIVNGKPAARASQSVDEDSGVSAQPAHPWVGRGALKLDHALALWPVKVERRIVLDVGASTGGFTEVCLARGAAKVYAVDVGRDQLHPRLKADPRVVDLHGCDARALDRSSIREPPDLIVCDVSFISLAKALPAALDLAAPGADLICLVKPQFEVGPAEVGRGGLVRSAAARERALAEACAFLEREGWSVQASTPSPILGGDGNAEWLVWARRR
jgi:23S rRNA (cytidine1920-2'-O)/16S rRNA (cytidine1409-2'-O)-methyltransferase